MDIKRVADAEHAGTVHKGISRAVPQGHRATLATDSANPARRSAANGADAASKIHQALRWRGSVSCEWGK